MEIKLTATQAHLIFEEIMAGDATESIEDVRSLLDETEWYCNAILNGGSNDEGTFYRAEDPGVREDVTAVLAQVKEFRQSVEDRYAHRISSQGIGSEVDQNFDLLYEDIQAGLDGFMTNPATVYAAGQARYGEGIDEELGNLVAAADQPQELAFGDC